MRCQASVINRMDKDTTRGLLLQWACSYLEAGSRVRIDNASTSRIATLFSPAQSDKNILYFFPPYSVWDNTEEFTQDRPGLWSSLKDFSHVCCRLPRCLLPQPSCIIHTSSSLSNIWLLPDQTQPMHSDSSYLLQSPASPGVCYKRPLKATAVGEGTEGGEILKNQPLYCRKAIFMSTIPSDWIAVCTFLQSLWVYQVLFEIHRD